MLRLRDPHAEHRPARRRRHPLHELPHDVAVLTDPRVVAHRPQPPRGGHGLARQLRPRLRRLPRRHPPVGRAPPGGAARARLEQLRRRQVAPHADAPHRAHRAVPHVAHPARLRPLLRVHGRRDEPVGTLPHRGQPPHRHPRHPRLPPHHRPDEPGDHAGERPAVGGTGATVPALSRVRCRPLAAPRSQGTHRRVRAGVREGVGRHPRRTNRPSEGDGPHPGRHPAATAQPWRARMGRPDGRAAAAVRPLPGCVRGDDHPHRPRDRADDRRARTDGRTATTPCSWS